MSTSAEHLAPPDSLWEKEEIRQMSQYLINELKAELKTVLMETAEAEVDKVIEVVSKRFIPKIEKYYNPLYQDMKVNLTWLLKKEN